MTLAWTYTENAIFFFCGALGYCPCKPFPKSSPGCIAVFGLNLKTPFRSVLNPFYPASCLFCEWTHKTQAASFPRCSSIHAASSEAVGTTPQPPFPRRKLSSNGVWWLPDWPLDEPCNLTSAAESQAQLAARRFGLICNFRKRRWKEPEPLTLCFFSYLDGKDLDSRPHTVGVNDLKMTELSFLGNCVLKLHFSYKFPQHVNIFTCEYSVTPWSWTKLQCFRKSVCICHTDKYTLHIF